MLILAVRMGGGRKWSYIRANLLCFIPELQQYQPEETSDKIAYSNLQSNQQINNSKNVVKNQRNEMIQRKTFVKKTNKKEMILKLGEERTRW